MSAGARLAALLAVQKQRVDRAMAIVQERNEEVRQRESERQTALERWEAAVVAYRLQRQRLIDSIANPGGRSGIKAGQLNGGALRCDAHREWVAGAQKALAEAEGLLAAASSAAVEARAIYRRTIARQDALMTLQAGWRKARGQRMLRLEEQEA